MLLYNISNLLGMGSQNGDERMSNFSKFSEKRYHEDKMRCIQHRKRHNLPILEHLSDLDCDHEECNVDCPL